MPRLAGKRDRHHAALQPVRLETTRLMPEASPAWVSFLFSAEPARSSGRNDPAPFESEVKPVEIVLFLLLLLISPFVLKILLLFALVSAWDRRQSRKREKALEGVIRRALRP